MLRGVLAILIRNNLYTEITTCNNGLGSPPYAYKAEQIKLTHISTPQEHLIFW